MKVLPFILNLLGSSVAFGQVEVAAPKHEYPKEFHVGALFLVQELGANDFKLVNAKGEFPLKNNVANLVSTQNFMKNERSAPYYESTGILKYTYDEHQVLDLYELKQVLFTPPQLKILGIEYINKREMKADTLEEERMNSVIFVIVLDENRNWFYMDLEGKKYLPKSR